MRRPFITVGRLDRDCGTIVCAAVLVFMLWRGISLLSVSDACKEWLFWGFWAVGAVYAAAAFVRGVRFLLSGGGLDTLKK